MEEVWKSVIGYEGLYEVSNLGTVRSLTRQFKRGYIAKTMTGRIMKLRLHPAGKRSGYYQITFGDRKRFYVHRLVAMMFIENINNYPCINHKDGNGLNNNMNNLEWCSYSQNKLHSLNVLNCKVANEKPVLDLQTGVFYTSQKQAFLSRIQPVKFSQFTVMLAGKWPNRTDFIRV